MEKRLSVARICNLLYRRFVIGGAWKQFEGPRIAARPPNTILRCSRLKIFATTLNAYETLGYSQMSRRDRRRGFSLIEILCAVLVLGVALTGLIQGVTTALSSSKESELQTVAALFAAGQVETLRAEGDLRDGTTEGDCGEGLALYRWQQTITAAGIDGLHEVAVAVENSKSGATIYELRTLLFEV